MAIINYDYLEIFQVALSIVFIVGVGIFCGWWRLFTSDQASEIRKALNLICIPGLVFRQIARNPLKLHTWQPFFNALLVQVTIHILYAIICFSFPFKNKTKRFMEISCATTSADFIYYSLSMTKFMYGNTSDYEYIPAFQSLVHFFFLIPLYTLFGYVFTKVDKSGKGASDAEPAYYQSEKDEDLSKSKSDDEEDEIELEEGIESGPTVPINPVSQENKNSEISEQNGQINSQIEIESDKEENQSEGKNSFKSHEYSIDSINEENKMADEDLSYSEEAQKKEIENENENDISELSSESGNVSLKSAIFSTLVNPVTVCAVLGIIWSATGIKMVTFLDETSNTLQKAVLGAGLFIIGLFMFFHPFIKFNISRVVFFIFIHYFIIPLISLFWAYILKLDSTQAIPIVISHVAPLGIFGSVLAKNTGYKMKCVSYTFFWSNVSFLPIFMLWVIFLKEITIFPN